MEVDAVDLEAQVVVDQAHPLGVPLGQVGVHRDQVGAPARQGVQVEGHGGHQRLPLPGGHLGHGALVEGDGAQELDVVGHHVPLPLLAGHGDRVAQVAAARLLHHGEGLGEELVEDLLGLVQELALEVRDLLAQVRPVLGVLGVALLVPLLLDRGLQVLGPGADPLPEHLGLPPELLLGEVLVRLRQPVDLVDRLLLVLGVPLVAGADDLLQKGFQHGSRYSRWRSMIRRTASGTR